MLLFIVVLVLNINKWRSKQAFGGIGKIDKFTGGGGVYFTLLHKRLNCTS